MTAFDQAIEEIASASYPLALEGGGSVLAAVGTAILTRMGYPPAGKASVKFDIDEKTVISITWDES